MYSVLKFQKQFVGLHDSHAYIVGFKDKKFALRTKKILPKHARIELHRSDTVDISRDVNQGLTSFGLRHLSFQSLTIDTMATIIFHKADMTLKKSPYIVEEMSEQDFMCLPFEKHVGVIMPYKVLDETSSTLVYASQVIDPIDDIKLFQKNLSLMNK
jgi:hypothetical protein